jgi:NADH:ubiquinone oxidoreductase subunit 4 (subunit M)
VFIFVTGGVVGGLFYVCMVFAFLVRMPMSLVRMPVSLVRMPMFLVKMPMFLVRMPMFLVRMPMFLVKMPMFLVKMPMFLVRMPMFLVRMPMFLVRMPMFLVHLWLPRAHVEAPVSGSMILAGVLLKLGGYGLLRVSPILSRLGFGFGIVSLVLGLVGGLLVSLFCMRQTDLKSLIAYSSVAHIGIVIGGIMTMGYWGVCGYFALMIAVRTETCRLITRLLCILLVAKTAVSFHFIIYFHFILNAFPQ